MVCRSRWDASFRASVVREGHGAAIGRAGARGTTDVTAARAREPSREGGLDRRRCDATATLFERRHAAAATVKSRGPHRWNAFGDRTARSLKQAARARSRRRIRPWPGERRDAAAVARNIKARHGDGSTETSARGSERAVPLSQPKGAEGLQPTLGDEARRRHPSRRDRRRAAPRRDDRSRVGLTACAARKTRGPAR